MSKKRLLQQLYLTRGVGNKTIQKILAQIPDDSAVSQLTANDLIKLGEISRRQDFAKNFQEVLDHPEWLKYLNTLPHFTTLDALYPPLLKEMYQFPSLLFFQGNTELLAKPSLAVVGTRDPLPHLKPVLEKVLPPLLNELVIVSGLAEGTDALAHQLTLENNGATIAVLGNGLNIFYPRKNRQLQETIAKRGLLLSEYLPQAEPRRHHFPMRNRIIAGLTLGTVVVAAKERSGSLITAQMALENNREVFAIPGSILDKKFSGCLSLIQEGAKCVQNATDIIEEIRFS
ncbi:DNA-processing protein DprA [Enterococcus timonensis]|uniref:DNA-processing protein DprA n=1 Tax=Enterococcus timonensis TaxID=1852364 RepID=UPI0008DA6260|nr:DNA-processing protein DprA [Enterococcus timonensis]